MNHMKAPAVECDSRMEFKMERDDFRMEFKRERDDPIPQREDNAQPEVIVNVNESNDVVLPEVNQKRKIKEEQDGNPETASKKPRNDSNDKINSTTDCTNEQPRMLDSGAESDEVYSLLVSDFPETWTFPQICNYVSQSLKGVSVELEPVMGKERNKLRLTFNSAEHRTTAQTALQDKQVDSNKLAVVIEAPVQYENDRTPTEQVSTEKHDIWEEDPKGLYGLKQEYLDKLNITPPIGKWVHVTNFRCDKSELRDAFELAGTMVVCSIVNAKEKIAKIMYSHPLEAVQAISMLHEQVFYGLKLNVTMDKALNSQPVLPKGLSGIGPGLGEDGNVLREIKWEYERFLNGKSSKINMSLFTAGNIDGIVIAYKNNYVSVESKPSNNTQMCTNSPPIDPKSVPTTGSPKPMSPNPTANRPVRPNFGNIPATEPTHYRYPNSIRYRASMPSGSMAGAMGQMGDMGPPGPFSRGFPPAASGRMPMPFGQRPLPAQMRPRGPICLPIPNPGPSPPWPTLQPVELVPQMSKCLDASTLKIVNLPPTTSFPSLCGKLSTLAQVTSLQFTTPGCAIVKFASPSDADKCFQNYHSIELS